MYGLTTATAPSAFINAKFSCAEASRPTASAPSPTPRYSGAFWMPVGRAVARMADEK